MFRYVISIGHISLLIIRLVVVHIQNVALRLRHLAMLRAQFRDQLGQLERGSLQVLPRQGGGFVPLLKT